MTAEALTILLAEDDEGQATLIHRSFERARLAARIVRLRSSREVLEYFAQPAGVAFGDALSLCGPCVIRVSTRG